jgi:exosome complex RNA-binding protein Rrp4
MVIDSPTGITSADVGRVINEEDQHRVGSGAKRRHDAVIGKVPAVKQQSVDIRQALNASLPVTSRN